MEIRVVYSLQIMRKIQRIRSTYFAFKKCAESPKLDLIENSIITKRKKKILQNMARIKKCDSKPENII